MHRVFLLFALAATLPAQVVTQSPFSLTVTAGNNQTAYTNTTFAQPVAVQVLDGNGRAVVGGSVTFTLPPLSAGAAGATFVTGNQFSATVTTNNAGFALSPRFTSDSPLGTFNVTAKFGATSANSTEFVTFPPPPSAPDIAPNYLSYFMVFGDKAPPSQTLTIASGSGSYPVTSDSTWLKFVQRGPQFLDVSVDPTGLAAGKYEGRLSFNNGLAIIRVFLTIQPLPSLYSSVSALNFNYVQYRTVLPLLQDFYIGSSVRNFPIQAAVTYNNPSTGKWLGIASKVGMVTPAHLIADVDPRGLDPGTYTASITFTGDVAKPLTIPVTLVVTKFAPSPRTPLITSFANAATLLDGGIAAGELVRMSGDNLSCAGMPTVTVGGDAAEILSAAGGEVRLIVPDSVAGLERVSVQWSCGDLATDSFSVPVQTASPAIFTRDSSQALAYNDDQFLNGDGTPAQRGNTLTVFGTGFGALDSGTGNFVAPVSVTVGGEAAELLAAERSADMPGVSRIKLRVPVTILEPGRAEIQVQAGTERASANVAVK